jgi:putative redox protein
MAISKPTSFTNSRGQKLAATLDLPDGAPPVAWALFAHCFTCGRKLKPMVRIDEVLTEHGIAVLRFDFAGVGDSEGDFAQTNLSSNREDLVDAARWLAASQAAPQLLLGHSLGGAAVLAAAREIPSAAAVAVLATPSEPGRPGGLLAEKRREALATGEAALARGGRIYRLRPQFFTDLESTQVKEAVRDLRRPLLILHAVDDGTVSIASAEALFRAARHPKSFVALGGADHLLLDELDAQYAGRVIAAWASRYL